MVGIYARLSREDDKLGVSESIDNQIKFLKNYANEHNWDNVTIYIDDGYTGTNFDRPGFKQMIEYIEAGKIRIVITKDLSRLGRDYIDTGYYIEKYFPSKRIRYIAVNDGVDTLDELNSNNDITPFKAVINDMYAKDISKKVKSALITKAINGESIKPFAPYGYVKKGKNNLVVDTRVAENITRIFEMYLSGNSKKEICNYLNNNDIIPPLMYKLQYTNYKNPNKPSKKWSVSTISNILKDRIYIGDLVQHKYSSVNYKIKKVVRVEKGKNIVIENHHQPIIEREKFYRVQKLLEQKANECKRQARSEHVLTGLAFCGKCGARITYTKNHGSEFKIICSGYKKNGKRFCEGIYMGEKELVESVKRDILEKFEQQGIRDIRLSSGEIEKEQLKELEKEKQKNMRAIKHIYSDLAKCAIGKEMAIEIIEEYVIENREIDKRVARLKEGMGEKVINIIEEIKQANDSEIRSLFYTLIEKIELIDNAIAVQYKFKK